MVPEKRVQDGTFPIPKLFVGKEDIDQFTDEFRGFHAQFADCFSREEPRETFVQYMAGQMSQLERKSIEPIAMNVENAKVRAMQHFISNVVWNEARIISRYHDMVVEDLGDTEGVLIFDESGFVKKGGDSAGVARQYCGNIGKVENCQVGVFAAYGGYSADSATRFRRKPPPCSDAKRHGIPDDSATPGRSVATLVF